MPRRAAATPENAVVKACLAYLALRGIFAYRNNTGAFAGTHNGKRRFVRFGALGAPDIIAVVRGRYVGIEAKRPGGGRLSPAQLAFHANLRAAGGVALVVRSVDELIEALEGLGT